MNKTYIIVVIVLAGVLVPLLGVYFWLGKESVITPTASPPQAVPVVSQTAPGDVSAAESELLAETSALEADLADLEAFEKDVSLNSLEADLSGLTE